MNIVTLIKTQTQTQTKTKNGEGGVGLGGGGQIQQLPMVNSCTRKEPPCILAFTRNFHTNFLLIFSPQERHWHMMLTN